MAWKEVAVEVRIILWPLRLQLLLWRLGEALGIRADHDRFEIRMIHRCRRGGFTFVPVLRLKQGGTP